MDESRQQGPSFEFRGPEWMPAGVSFADQITAGDAPFSVRRRLLLLVSAGVALSLATAWVASNGTPWVASEGPRQVVRDQIEHVGNGRLRDAYDLFSPKYRERVTFELWRALMVAHRDAFRARSMRLEVPLESEEEGLVLEAYVVVESGQRYRARYSMVRVEGRWWVDDLHWGAVRRSDPRMMA